MRLDYRTGGASEMRRENSQGGDAGPKEQKQEEEKEKNLQQLVGVASEGCCPSDPSLLSFP